MLDKFLPTYPTIQSSKFNDVIVSRKEFADERLAPSNPFGQQTYIPRFVSPLTGYDELLLYHEMGTGKTCTAISVAENMKNNDQSFIFKTLIVAKGVNLLKNFVHELLFTCIDDRRYVPADYNRLTDREKTLRVRKLVGANYTLKTFITFAKEINRLSDEELKQRYENHLIVIDEIQNVRRRFRTGGGAVDVYAAIHRLAHVLRKRKILLLSGTPMKDDVAEFADVMNIILPLDEQLKSSSSDEFIRTYLETEDGRSNLRRAVVGRTSFLRAQYDKVQQMFQGRTNIGTLTEFVVDVDVMSTFQTEHYLSAFRDDRSEDQSIYNRSRQAALFVFPDGTYGPAGFTNEQYVATRGRRYAIGPTLRAAVVGTNATATIDNIARYSSKYAATLERIYYSGNKSFVYCEFVRGSGCILFAGLLELLGYREYDAATGSGIGRRYVIITSELASSNEIRQQIDAFNGDSSGERIQVLIGSKSVVEGFSLKDVVDEHILTPHWNYAETAQAIARGYRQGSHAASGATTMYIFQHVSLTSTRDTDKSIDLLMYERSERKDRPIKAVERIVKEISFDCPLTIDRNLVVGGRDGSRECDYQQCDFTCDGQIGSTIDRSSFNVYYYDDKPFVEYLRDHFRKSFDYIDIDSLQLPTMDRFELIKSLANIAGRSTVFHDRHGFSRFLRINGPIVCLSSKPNMIDLSRLDDYYIHTFIVEETRDFSRLTSERLNAKMDDIILSLETHLDYTHAGLASLPYQLQHDILRQVVAFVEIMKGPYKVPDKTAALQHKILSIYRDTYGIADDKWHVWLFRDRLDAVSMYDNGRWRSVDSKTWRPGKRKRPIATASEGPAIVGLLNPMTNDFCIRMEDEEIEPSTSGGRVDLRKVRVGKKCINWDLPKLVDLAARKLKLDVPSIFAVDDDPVAAFTEYVKFQRTFLGPNETISSVSVDDMRRTIYWKSKSRPHICEQIKRYLQDKGLIQDDYDCGKQQKRRVE